MRRKFHSEYGRFKGLSTIDAAKAMGLGRDANIHDIERAMRVGNAARLNNPIEEGRADIVPWYLYDRQFTAAAATTAVEYDYFTTPIGGSKTRQDTNMTQVQQLPNPQHFNCTSLQFYFSSRMNAVDTGTFLDTYYCEFWIGDKIYAQGPLSKFPAGAGLSGFAATTASTTTITAMSNGFPSPVAVVDFRMGNNPIGHHILQGQNFQVKVLTNAGFSLAAGPAIGLNLLVVLEGVLSRSVQ
jgi:hypothetical protein